MEKVITLLDEVKESIINAYEEKSHLSRNKIAKMMDDETWLNAKKALQLGFVDGILFSKKKMNPRLTPMRRKKAMSLIKRILKKNQMRMRKNRSRTSKEKHLIL